MKTAEYDLSPGSLSSRREAKKVQLGRTLEVNVNEFLPYRRTVHRV